MRNRLALAFLWLTAGSLTEAAVKLTTTGCADPSGLSKCLDTSESTSDKCLNNARDNNSELETLACGCDFYTDNINCYASHCWNRVYECEYQEYVVEYFSGCTIAKLPIPYFPAPDNAPDACSCNLGKLMKGMLAAVDEGNTCMSKPADFSDTLGSLNRIDGCKCCELSGVISNIYDICPDTDPQHAGMKYASQLESLLQTSFKDCESAISQYDCAKSLSFTAATTFYGPSDLPASGTGTLTEGSGAVTSPASGDTFTWTNKANTQVYTVKAEGSIESKSDPTKTGGSDSSAETGSSKGASNKDDDGALHNSVTGLIGLIGLSMTFVAA